MKNVCHLSWSHRCVATIFVMTKRSLDELPSKLVPRLAGMEAAFTGGQRDELNRRESQPRGWWLSPSTRGLAVSKFLWQAGFWLCQNLGLWHNSAGPQVGPGLLLSLSLCPNQSPNPVWPLLLVLFAPTERTELVLSVSVTVTNKSKMAQGLVSWSCQSIISPLGAKKAEPREQRQQGPSLGMLLGRSLDWREVSREVCQPHFF